MYCRLARRRTREDDGRLADLQLSPMPPLRLYQLCTSLHHTSSHLSIHHASVPILHLSAPPVYHLPPLHFSLPPCSTSLHLSVPLLHLSLPLCTTSTPLCTSLVQKCDEAAKCCLYVLIIPFNKAIQLFYQISQIVLFPAECILSFLNSLPAQPYREIC